MSNVQTDQGLLNRVYDVFVRHGVSQCMNHEGNCIYDHTPNGFGCAIGCDLPKEVAQHIRSVETIIDVLGKGKNSNDEKLFNSDEQQNAYAYVYERYRDMNTGFLTSLQRWHDHDITDLVQLRYIANVYDLVWPGGTDNE